MSAIEQPAGPVLTREAILAALRALSGELGYPSNHIPVKTQYLVESLFEEGKI